MGLGTCSLFLFKGYFQFVLFFPACRAPNRAPICVFFTACASSAGWSFVVSGLVCVFVNLCLRFFWCHTPKALGLPVVFCGNFVVHEMVLKTVLFQYIYQTLLEDLGRHLVVNWYAGIYCPNMAEKPEDPGPCQKCGSDLKEPWFDEVLGLWRSKCDRTTIHPGTGKSRPSAHEAFTAGPPMPWLHLLVIPAVKDLGRGMNFEPR